MIKGDYSVEEHEERLGDLKDIFHWPGRARLEISDTVIAHVPNCTTCKGWEYKARNFSLAALCQLICKDGKRVGFGAMTGSGFHHLSRILTKTALSKCCKYPEA